MTQTSEPPVNGDPVIAERASPVRLVLLSGELLGLGPNRFLLLAGLGPGPYLLEPPGELDRDRCFVRGLGLD